jgi:RNA polymerase sigma-70 factor, ECF subfamily
MSADLIRRMAEGDRDAFARFYDRHARQVFPLIMRIVRDPADAADVLQEVFWEAWQSAASYDPGRGTAEAWIFMRARTRAIDRVRAVRRRSETFVAPVDERVSPPRPTPAGTRPSVRRTATSSSALSGGCPTPSARCSSWRTTED